MLWTHRANVYRKEILLTERHQERIINLQEGIQCRSTSPGAKRILNHRTIKGRKKKKHREKWKGEWTTLARICVQYPQLIADGLSPMSCSFADSNDIFDFFFTGSILVQLNLTQQLISILFWICGCGGTWKVKSVRTLSWERDFPHCTKTLKGECWIEKWQVWALTLWRLYPLVYDCGLCLLHRFCLSTLTCLILGGTNFFWWTNLPNFLLPPNIYQNDPDFPPF